MDLKDLGNTPLQDAVDFDNLPAERGVYPPPPIPGAYRFALSPLEDANFAAVKSAEYGDRAKVKFDEAAPLVIVASPASAHNGEPFQTSLSNVPRPRGKEKNLASDWDYLNRALKMTARPKTNVEYAQTLIAASKSTPPAQFAADIEWSWGCNDQRDAYFATADAAGVVNGSAPVADPNNPGNNIKGCGAKYYQGREAKAADVAGKKAGTVVAVGGVFPLHHECGNCGASIRAFANLTRIRE